MKKQFCKSIALLDGLTTYHYKIIFLLFERERTQSQLSLELGIAKQNVYKVCKYLLGRNILYVSRIEGHNKFLAVNQTLEFQLPGQLSM